VGVTSTTRTPLWGQNTLHHTEHDGQHDTLTLRYLTVAAYSLLTEAHGSPQTKKWEEERQKDEFAICLVLL